MWTTIALAPRFSTGEVLLTARILAARPRLPNEEKLHCLADMQQIGRGQSYPHNPQCVGVRQAERVRVSIPAEIRAESGNQHAATLTNLSHSGAQLAVEKALGKAGDKLTLNSELAFAGLSHRMETTVTIKSLREDSESTDKKQCLHGVHFEGHSDQQHLMLHGFVYEQIAAGRMVA